MDTKKLGPTGKFPKGHFNKDDEGALIIGVAVDRNRLIINFGTLVAFIGLDKRSASQLIETLTRRSKELLDE